MTRELRVLSGLHAGARCPVQDGAVIGQDMACDIVLSDEGVPPRAATLHVGDACWSIHAQRRGCPSDPSDLGELDHLGELRELGDPRALDALSERDDLDDFGDLGDSSTPGDGGYGWNEPRQLAGVWITVAQVDAPWIDVPAALRAGTALADASDAQADAGFNAHEPSATFATDGLGKGNASGSGRAPSGSARWLTRGLMLLVILAILATIAVVLPARRAVPAARPPARTHAPGQALGAISAAIDNLGLAGSVHISVQPDGGLVVRGWVTDQTEEDRLARALAQIWPMPAMRISLQSAAMQTAIAALSTHKLRYRPIYLGDGRIAIHGVAPDALERVAALDAVRAQLPGMTVMGTDILLPAQVEHALTLRLSAAGLTGIALSWDDAGLRIAEPNLPDAQLARLQALLAAFNKDFFDIAKIRGGASSAAASDRVPFEIRSVMGGPQPFVVLGDGMKLVPGGSYRGYRLVAIDPKQLIFDGVQKAVVIR